MPSRSFKISLRELSLFGIGGVLGLAIDSAALLALHHLAHIDLYSGRLASFLCAATFTWAYNRSVTFRSRHPAKWSQWSQFVLVNSIGGLVNLGTYTVLLSTVAAVAEQPVLGVAAGSLAGFAFNYCLSKALVFRPGPSS